MTFPSSIALIGFGYVGLGTDDGLNKALPTIGF
jgi:hypothetical protein